MTSEHDLMSESLLPSAALCSLLELHASKQHQPISGSELVALLLDPLALVAGQRTSITVYRRRPFWVFCQCE